MSFLADDQLVKLADSLWEKGEISNLSRETCVNFGRALMSLCSLCVFDAFVAGHLLAIENPNASTDHVFEEANRVQMEMLK